jgi:ATP-dependent DNA helicase HFM1/MER3
MRIVCVSATLPNIDDIASFVDAHDAYEFDVSYRPVPLSTHVVGLGYVGKNQFLFDKGLNKHVPDLLRRFSDDKPSIVFCHTKKQTESLATELSSYYGLSRDTRLVEISNNTNLEILKRCLRSAVAYHHAGMDAGDRHLVEKAFAIGAVKCLCATSTLAMGVNLPAHLVIIKGTACWRGSGQGYSDIDSGTLLQMMGRAGRPGFDSAGTAVIMTDMKSKENYERLSSGLEVVESMLLKNLVETLNTEISQSVINNVSEAIDWLKGTFFYLRVRKNPRYYKLFGKTQEKLEDYLMKLCMEALENLHSSGIIRLLNQGNSVVPNQVSHIMSKHMVPFRTMQLMIDLPYDSEAPQILQMLSQMEGIHYPVRRAEKSLLNEAHKQIKYKLDGPLSKVRVQKPQQKAFVLLQCAIGHIYLQDYTLRQEMSTIVEYSKRMLSSFEDYSVEESRHGKLALECMLLRRCLAASLWGPGDFVLNQIQGIGLKSASKLAMNGIRTFGDILTKSSNAIEDSCGRTSPFGQQLRTAASKILQNSLGLSAYVQDLDSTIRRKDLVVQLTYRHGKDSEEYPGNNEIVSYTLSVFTDRPGGIIMFRTNICGPCVHKVSCPNIFGRIYIHLVANLVGLDESLQIDGESEVAKPSSLFSPKASNTKKERGKAVSSSKSKLPSIMSDMFTGISDIRMKRKSTENFATSNNVFTPVSSLKVSQHVSNLDRDTRESSMVTPSPHTPLKQSSIQKSAVGEPNQTSSRTYSSIPTKRLRTGNSINSTWQKEQKKQQNLQKRAFRSPKENPFAAFKFDPNDVEKVLEQESKKTLSEVKDEYSIHSSIIPPRQARVIGHDYGSHSQRRSRFFGPSRNSQYKSFFVGSATRNRVGSAHIITGEELLRLKAQEQQIFALSRENHPFRGESNKYMTYCKRMPFHGQASLIGPPYNYDQYNYWKGINNNILCSQRSNVCDQMHHINNNCGYLYNGVDQNYFDHLYTVDEPLHEIQNNFNSNVNGVDEEVLFPLSHHDYHIPTGEDGFPRGAIEGHDMNEYQTNFQRGDNDPMMEPNPFLNEYSHQNEPRNLQGMVITVEGNRNEDEIFDDAFL